MKKLLLTTLIILSLSLVGVVRAERVDSLGGSDASQCNGQPCAAIKINWQGIYSFSKDNPPNPIIFYKRVKNPVTKDASGCQYTPGNKDSNSGLSGATSTSNSSAQCYVWKQVGYMSGDYGWTFNQDNQPISTNNFVFIAPPTAKDAYGAPVAFKLAQGSFDSKGILQKWTGLRAFTVDQINNCNNNCLPKGNLPALFSDSGTNSNYRWAQLLPNNGNFQIGFDYSLKLPAFYQPPKIKNSQLTAIANFKGATGYGGSYVGTKIKQVMGSINSTTDGGVKPSTKSTPDQMSSAAVNLELSVEWDKTIISAYKGTWYHNFINLGFNSSTDPTHETLTFHDDNQGLYIQLLNSAYCLSNSKVRYFSGLVPLETLKNLPSYTCNRGGSNIVQFGMDSVGFNKKIPTVAFNDTYLFQSKGVAYVAGGFINNSQNSQQGMSLTFKNKANSQSTIFKSTDKYVSLSSLLTTDSSTSPMTLDLSYSPPTDYTTDPSQFPVKIAEMVYARGPIIATAAKTGASFNAENQLTSSFYVTTIPGYHISANKEKPNNLSFQWYQYQRDDICDNAKGQSTPCNPGSSANNGAVNIDSFDSTTGLLTIKSNEMAPADNYRFYGLLSSSQESYGEFSKGVWKNPNTCSNTVLPVVKTTPSLTNYCNFSTSKIIENTNKYTLGAPTITSASHSIQNQNQNQNQLITVNFTPPTLQPADVFNGANQLTGKGFTYSFPNLTKGLSVTTQPSCTDSSCSGVLNYSSSTPIESAEVTVQATLTATDTTDWLSAPSPVLSSPYTVYLSPLSPLTSADTTYLSPTKIKLSWAGGEPNKSGNGFGNTYKITATCDSGNCPGGNANKVTVANAVSPQTVTGLAPGNQYTVNISSIGTGYPGGFQPTVNLNVNPAPTMPVYKLNKLTVSATPSYSGVSSTGNSLSVDWRSNNHSGDIYYNINNSPTYVTDTTTNFTPNITYQINVCKGNVDNYADCAGKNSIATDTKTYADTSPKTFTNLSGAENGLYSVCVKASGNVVAPINVSSPMTGQSACASTAPLAFSDKNITFNTPTQNTINDTLKLSWKPMTITNGEKYNTDVSYSITCNNGCVISNANDSGELSSSYTTQDTDVTLSALTKGNTYTVSVTANAPDYLKLAPITSSDSVSFFAFPEKITGVTISSGTTPTDAIVSWIKPTISPSIPSGAAIAQSTTLTASPSGNTPTPSGSIVCKPASAQDVTTCTQNYTNLAPGFSYAASVLAKATLNNVSLSVSGKSDKNYSPSGTLSAPGEIKQTGQVSANSATISWSKSTLPEGVSGNISYKAVACSGDTTSYTECANSSNPHNGVVTGTDATFTFNPATSANFTAWVQAQAKTTSTPSTVFATSQAKGYFTTNKYVVLPPTTPNVSSSTTTVTVKGWTPGVVTPTPAAAEQANTSYKVYLCAAGKKPGPNSSCAFSANTSDIATGITFPTNTTDKLIPGTTYTAYITESTTINLPNGIASQSLVSQPSAAAPVSTKQYFLNNASIASITQSDSPASGTILNVDLNKATITSKVSGKPVVNPTLTNEVTYQWGLCAADSTSDACVTSWSAPITQGSISSGLTITGQLTPGSKQKLWVKTIPPADNSLTALSTSKQVAFYQFDLAPVISTPISQGNPTNEPTVSWSAATLLPAGDSTGSAITYTVTAANTQNPADTISSGALASSNLSYTFTDEKALTLGDTYNITVTANATVQSDKLSPSPSNAATYTAIQYALSAPSIAASDLSATATAITLSGWTAGQITPTNGPTPTNLSYSISLCPTQLSAPDNTCTTQSANAPEAVTFNDLTPNQTYYMFVKESATVADQALSTISTAQPVTTQSGLSIAFPENMVVELKSEGGIFSPKTASWTPAVVTGNGTAQYSLSGVRVSGDEANPLKCTATEQATSTCNGGIVQGVCYKLTLQASLLNTSKKTEPLTFYREFGKGNKACN